MRTVPLLIAVIVALSRLPFAAHELFEWDSVLYARAIERGFHVDTEIEEARPHPPGSIFYVALASLLRMAGAASNEALVALAIAASALAAAAVYLLARRFARPLPSAIAALGLAASPLFWLHSEIAMPYTVLAALTTGFASALLRVRETGRARIAASLALGLAAGVRQDLPLLLGPLWVWAIAPAPPRARLLGACAAAAGCLVWLVPSALLSDGLGPYVAAVLRQTSHVAETSSAPAGGLAGNLALMLYATAWGLGGFVVPMIALRAVRDLPATFFALWIVPPALLYAGLHIGEPGYVLSVVPGLYVVGAAVLDRLSRGARPVLAGGALLVAINGALFVSGVAPFSSRAIAEHDRSLSARVAYVRAHVTPGDAVILAQFDYALARYYLPDHIVLFVGEGPERLARAPVRRSVQPGRAFLFGATTALPESVGLEPVALGLARLGAGPAVTAYALEEPFREFSPR